MCRRSALCNTILIVIAYLGMITPSSAVSINASLSSTDTYTGSLSSSSEMFARPYGSSVSSYYYQLVKVTVYTSGTYTLTSSSSIYTFGCLYNTFFNRFNPYDSLIAYNDGGASSGQFQISYYLESGRTYILVVTTSSTYTIGNFMITATGSGIPSMSTYSIWTTTRYGSLWSSNPTFTRPGGISSHYYYDSYDVTISTTGTYTFQSRSSSLMDTYGCLYRGNFYSSTPSINQIACDDDTAGNRQFRITGNLDSSSKYILVVTTSFSYTTGSYSVDVTGPSSASMSITTPSITSVGPIVGGIIGAVVFLLIILIIVISVVTRRRRQAVFVQTPVATQYNQNVSYPTVHQSPYGVPPPSYNPYTIPNKQY